MTDKIPSTPAAVATEVLKRIEENRELFDMASWAGLGINDDPILPGAECGTTMCAAGWTAHVVGWKLYADPWNGYIRAEGPNGEDGDVDRVAQMALGLTEGQTFWYQSEEEALEKLRVIARGDGNSLPDQWEDYEEDAE